MVTLLSDVLPVTDRGCCHLLSLYPFVAEPMMHQGFI